MSMRNQRVRLNGWESVELPPYGRTTCKAGRRDLSRISLWPHADRSRRKKAAAWDADAHYGQFSKLMSWINIDWGSWCPTTVLLWRCVMKQKAWKEFWSTASRVHLLPCTHELPGTFKMESFVLFWSGIIALSLWLLKPGTVRDSGSLNGSISRRLNSAGAWLTTSYKKKP